MKHDITQLCRTPESDITRSAVDDVERAVRENDPAVFDVVRDLVKKPGVDPHVRAALLLQLVALPSREVERVLLDALYGDQPDVVRVRACDALGQVGAESTLPALEKIAADAAGPLKTQAAFAHTLICHRLRRSSKLLEGLTHGERAPISGVGAAFASGALMSVERAEVLGHIREGRWRVAPVGHQNVAIQCGTRSWSVLLHDFVAGEGLSGVLRAAPAVLGVVMRKSEEHKRWSVSRVLLGGPREKEGVYVLAFRRDGVLDLRGDGSLEERMIDLHSVQRPGALAVSARAYWHGSHVTVAGIASMARSPGRSPRAISAAKKDSVPPI